MAEAGEEIALLSEQIKAGARSFLDEIYQSYLEAADYESPSPVHILEQGWNRYSARYDLSRRPQPNGYQRLLLDHSYDHSANGLLRALDRKPNLASQLRDALTDVPEAERPLIEAVLRCREGDLLALAESWPDPTMVLVALRYLNARQYALPRLRAALKLDERLGSKATLLDQLAALVYAVNLGASPEAESAWHSLTTSEQRRLSGAVNLLFASEEHIHLALCAMRAVGDTKSLELIERSRGNPHEGVTQSSSGSEASWEPIRREAIQAISRRQHSCS